MPKAVLALSLGLLTVTTTAFAQFPPGRQGSANMHVVAHIPRGAGYRTADIEVEQELARPYAYVSSRLDQPGTDIVSLKDPNKAFILYRWRIEQPELHQGSGGMQNKYFKLRSRYYDVQSTQFRGSGPDGDLGAVVLDVTGLPDTNTIKIVARVRAADAPGGFHNIYNYKHSDGRVLMFATSGPGAKIYDMDRALAADTARQLVGRVPVPANPGDLSKGYHDFYVGYDPATHQDRFYGAGGGGYYVFDVTRPEEPKLLTTLVGIAGMNWGHTFTPTPDGRYAIGEAEWQYQPLRIFDLKPGLDGQVKVISRPMGAWTADWQNLAHNTEVRWPYVFVSGYEDGLYVFNMMDPANPYTVGYYDTFDGPHNKGAAGSNTPTSNFTWGIYDGAFGVDVRNADGLIVISDFTTGFWAIKMDGFDGWNGHQWGMPNVSSAQDWDNGPDGAPKPAKVSSVSGLR
ncbi:MAG: hypothetical protein HY700_00465 [Gemmatimonadetes bacterium]|nr:hypothetical protein [Gemmatimonadota bacterium]